MAENTEFETWRSSIPGTIVVKKYDRRGDITEEVILGNRSFQITPDERLFNQDLSASPEQDPFRNGMMQPVRLLDGTEDKADIASNPNLLSESDMKLMFSAHYKTFEARTKSISNATTLMRLREVAEEVDATMKQVAVIDARLRELNPIQVKTNEQVGPATFKSTADLKPSTP